MINEMLVKEIRIGRDSQLIFGFHSPFFLYVCLFNFRYYRLKAKDKKWERVFFALYFGYHRFVDQFAEGWEFGLTILDHHLRLKRVSHSGMEEAKALQRKIEKRGRSMNA